jgi:hypothetical protein
MPECRSSGEDLRDFFPHDEFVELRRSIPSITATSDMRELMTQMLKNDMRIVQNAVQRRSFSRVVGEDDSKRESQRSAKVQLKMAYRTVEKHRGDDKKTNRK